MPRCPAASSTRFGGFGIHKFYLGTWGWGLIYLVVSSDPAVTVGHPRSLP